MALLDRYLFHPLLVGGSAVLTELGHVTHPLVYAMEQPVTNIIRDSTEIVSGVYHVAQSAIHVAPYLAGAWLGWSFFGMYFPREKRALEGGISNAAKRIRGTPTYY
jgi:hypothetical protein